MAIAEQRCWYPLRPSNNCVPSSRPSMLPLLSSPLRIVTPLPSVDAVSPRPDRSGGFLWRWDASIANDLLSVRTLTPVTRFSLRLATRAGRPVGGAPIYSPASLQNPDGLYGPPPPAPRLRGGTQPLHPAYAALSSAPSGKPPVLRKRHSAMSHCRATATLPRRLRRLPPPPKRARNQPRRALSGW